jgi:hypothetical protein
MGGHPHSPFSFGSQMRSLTHDSAKCLLRLIPRVGNRRMNNWRLGRASLPRAPSMTMPSVISVVEDDASVRAVMSNFFRARGHVVHTLRVGR